MARRSDHTRSELKKLILAQSWEIIEENGLEGLTARSIANRIGYAPGTIYNIFQSMEDLVLHINGRTLDILYDVLNSPTCRVDGIPPVENMKVMANLYMDFTREYRPYWLMLFNHQLPEKEKS